MLLKHWHAGKQTKSHIFSFSRFLEFVAFNHWICGWMFSYMLAQRLTKRILFPCWIDGDSSVLTELTDMEQVDNPAGLLLRLSHTNDLAHRSPTDCQPTDVVRHPHNSSLWSMLGDYGKKSSVGKWSFKSEQVDFHSVVKLTDYAENTFINETGSSLENA